MIPSFWVGKLIRLPLPFFLKKIERSAVCDNADCLWSFEERVAVLVYTLGGIGGWIIWRSSGGDIGLWVVTFGQLVLGAVTFLCEKTSINKAISDAPLERNEDYNLFGNRY
jgi:hypothetical protein